MFEAMERGELPARLRASARTPRSPRPTSAAPIHLLEGLDHLVVQDIFLTKTAELADVVLPGRGRVVRDRGHGHELRAPGAARAARRSSRRGGARDDIEILTEVARRLGARLAPTRSPRRCGTSCARCRRCTAA